MQTRAWQPCWVVLRRCSVRISAGKPPNLALPLQPNAGMEPQSGCSCRLLPHAFQFTTPSDVMQSVQLPDDPEPASWHCGGDREQRCSLTQRCGCQRVVVVHELPPCHHHHRPRVVMEALVWVHRPGYDPGQRELRPRHTDPRGRHAVRVQGAHQPGG